MHQLSSLHELYLLDTSSPLKHGKITLLGDLEGVAQTQSITPPTLAIKGQGLIVKMHRILCLHGHGTSAAIFQSQTAAFRSKLDNSFVFDFVDAPFSSSPAPGITAMYSAAETYTWWEKADAQSIRASHRWVAAYARDHGPYDAVCCFSQGCSLAASMALYHAIAEEEEEQEEDQQPLPFRAAILICGGVPLAALEDMGIAVSQRAHDINQRTGSLLNEAAGRLADLKADLDLIQPGIGLWDIGQGLLLHDPATKPGPDDVFGLDFTAFPRGARIKMPTVHIYGSKDPRWPAAIQLAEFCDDKVEFDHQGGHDIPRSTAVSSQIAALIENLMDRIGVDKC